MAFYLDFILTAVLIGLGQAITSFSPICALPESRVNVVSSVNVRSTWDILWECLFALSICTWTVQHLNIPGEKRPDKVFPWQLQFWRPARNEVIRKMKWMLITLVLPEIILGLAFQDWINARNFRKLGFDSESSEIQILFANMGGFVIVTDIEESNDSKVSSEVTEGIMDDLKRYWNVPTQTKEERMEQGIAPVDGRLHLVVATSDSDSVETPAEGSAAESVHERTDVDRIEEDQESPQTVTTAPSEVQEVDSASETAAVSHASAAEVEAAVETLDSRDTTSNENRDPVTSEQGLDPCAEYCQSLVSDAAEQVTELQQERPPVRLYLNAIQWVVAKRMRLTETIDRQRLPSAFPVEIIQDRSKGDSFVKGTALAHILYLVSSTTFRLSQGLAVAQLEIVTSAFCTLMAVSYFFWWSKPQNVTTPVERNLAEPITRGEVNFLNKFCGESFFATNFQLPAYRPRPSIENPIPDDLHLGAVFHLVGIPVRPSDVTVCVTGLAFGAMHIPTWSMQYPTKWEPTVWKYATVSTALVPVIFASFNWFFAARIFTKEPIREKWPSLCYAALGLFMLLYLALRLFIIGDMFWLLFNQPVNTFSQPRNVFRF